MFYFDEVLGIDRNNRKFMYRIEREKLRDKFLPFQEILVLVMLSG